MKALGALLCWVGFHKPGPNIKPKFCIWWVCARCDEVLTGGFHTRRKRR